MVKPIAFRNARAPQAYVSHTAPRPFHRTELSTSGTVRDELFGSLDLYSEVKVIGRRLLSSNGHTAPSKAQAQLQAYLRQGKAFFQAAELLDYRASPLSYYYSFMNLAKACALVRDPKFNDANLHHGLSAGAGTGALRNHDVLVRSAGVFQIFYQSILAGSLPRSSRLNVAKLLGYVSDVSHEYHTLKFGTSRVHNGRMAGVIGGNQQAHGLLAVGATYKEQKPPPVLVRSKHFEVVQLGAIHASNIFALPADQARGMLFVETKKTFPPVRAGTLPMKDIAEEIVAALGDSLSINPFSGPWQFAINETMPGRIAMQEVLAIYLVMFYLGSLVRYRPWILEAMLDKKEAWIVERFVKTTPLTFLRYMRNIIDGQNLVYVLR